MAHIYGNCNRIKIYNQHNLTMNGGHGRWKSFSGMYMFQFIGHIQQEPDNHHDNDCIRCTGVFLGKNIIFNGVHGSKVF